MIAIPVIVWLNQTNKKITMTVRFARINCKFAEVWWCWTTLHPTKMKFNFNYKHSRRNFLANSAKKRIEKSLDPLKSSNIQWVNKQNLSNPIEFRCDKFFGWRVQIQYNFSIQLLKINNQFDWCWDYSGIIRWAVRNSSPMFMM